MADKLVSVLMTIYNNQDYIVEALESVLDMDYKRLEFILVDDGSTDRSVELVAPYMAKDSRVRLYCHEKNMGVPRATKTGIQHCQGEYILFAAADDVSLPERARACVELFEQEPGTGLLVSLASIIDGHSRATGEIYGPPQGIDSSNLALHQLKRNYCLGAALALRNDRRLLSQPHILELADDYQLSLEYILHGYRLGVLNEVLVRYRIHSSNVSNNQGALTRRVVAALQDYDIDKLAHSLQVQGFAQGDILVAVAIFEMFRGRAESGLRLMEQSESHEILEPGASFERLFYLAWGDYRSGKHRDALVKLEQAAALKPGDPALLNNKGVVLRWLGEPSDMSRDCWEKSLLLFPGYMDAEHNLTQADTDNLKYTSRILEAARVRRNTYNTN